MLNEILGINLTVDEWMTWAIQSSLSNITNWVSQVLAEDYRFYPVELRRLTPDEVLLTVFRYADEVQFQLQLKEAVAALAHTVSWTNERPRYLSNLLVAMGYLNVRTGYDLLTRIGLKSKLVSRFVRPGVSLHRFLLSSLAGMGCDSKSVHLFLRDVRIPEYAGLCFRALWPYAPDSAVEVSDYVVKLGAEDTHFPCHLLLKEMLAHLPLETAGKTIYRIALSPLLGETHKAFFGDLVRSRSLGFIFRPRRDHFVLIRVGAPDDRVSVSYDDFTPETFRCLLGGWIDRYLESHDEDLRPKSLRHITPVFISGPAGTPIEAQRLN